MATWLKTWMGALVVACLLQACGGGADKPKADAEQGENVLTVSQALQGTVLTTAHTPVAGAQVRWRDQTATTDAQGRFQFSAAGSTGDALQVTHTGHAPGVHRLAGAAADNVVVLLTPHGAQQTLDVATGGDVVDTGTGARVSLPPAGLVLHGGTQAASGDVTVTLTSIDPATNPGAMPGSYLVRAAGGNVVPIESYGAIHVSLTDTQGRRLDLAPGQRATIRIPVSSRSATPPATMPLLYLDEATGIWAFDGQAELKGSAPAWYYEGTVSHFTYWNADIALDTVYLSGCLLDTDGRPAVNHVVSSDGVDYTGAAHVSTDAQGRFTLPLRRGSRALLATSAGEYYLNAELGPFASDTTVDTCYRLQPTPADLTLVRQPEDTTAVNGVARFVVQAAGTGTLGYQWQRNGVDIPYANGPSLTLWAMDATDGDKFRVIVRQAQNELISREAVLRIPAESPPVVVDTARTVYVNAGDMLTLSVNARGSGNLSYQWRFNGQNISGATGPALSIPGFNASHQGAYRVVVSNGAGSTESPVWTASLPPSGSGTGGSETGSVPAPSLVRDVLSQVLNADEVAYFATAGLADMDGAINLLGPEDEQCTRGTAALTLDGTRVTQMRMLTPDTPHALSMSFNQCAADNETLYNGGLSLVQLFSGLPATGKRTSLQSTFSNFSVGVGSALFNGGFDIEIGARAGQDSYTTEKTIEPRPGASVRLANNGTVLVFTGGQAVVSEESRYTLQTGVSSLSITQAYEGLSLTASGTGFTVTGSLTSTWTGSNSNFVQTYTGEVILRSGSQQVGRVFVDAQGRLMVDVGGDVSPFAEL